MRVTYNIVILSLTYFIAVVYALPAKPVQEEVEIVPLEDQYGTQPIVDTDAFGGPFSNPFGDLFGSLAGMMARMRQQMDFLLRRLPIGNATGDSPFPGFPIIPQVDLNKGNTTSVTKVIDGHKVVINETEYKQDGDFGGTFFKVRIIDVKPDSSELTTEKGTEEVTESSKNAESVENSFENEIPKNKEVEVLRNVDEVDSRPQKITHRSSPWDNIETFESFDEDNSIESSYPEIDLSRDIYVNEWMADAGAPMNPDAEVFSSVETNVPTGRRSSQFDKFMYPR